MPLVMHDLQLAPDSARESFRNGDIHSLKMTKKVSQVIDLHPGPIELFRVDSSTWRSGNSMQWRVWVHKLINKNVEEIIIYGRWPRLPMEALPNNLVHCKFLKKLHLCFFSLPKIAENTVFPYLTELHLYYCMFEGSDLDNILHSCDLIVLTLGYVELGVLQIQSQTLQLFGMWRCNVDNLCLSGTPCLTDFNQEPQWTLDHMSHLQLRGISNLQVLSEIYLDQQTVELYGYLIKRTGPAIDWHEMFSTIPCIKKNLNIFELCYAHGDDVENDLAEAICRCAAALKEFRIDLNTRHHSRTGIKCSLFFFLQTVE